GDAHCLELFPDGMKPFCGSGEGDCAMGSEHGCGTLEEIGEACHLPCGRDPDPACDDGTLDDSSGSDTEGTASTTLTTTGPTTTVGPETETAGETETPTDCVSDEE